MAAAPTSVPSLRDLRDPVAVADALARDFAVTARERDRRGGTPKEERDALRESGLLTLSIPARFGGGGASWTTTMRTVRSIARADGSLAHVFGFQHLLLATVRLFGAPAQFEALARATVAERWFWGNALNPLDPRATLTLEGSERILRGEKSFCSGARDADQLVVSATNVSTGKLAVFVLPANRRGISLRDDWDNMGQRQTDSGSASFDNVLVKESELLTQPGPLGSTFATLRPLLAQLSLVNVYLGIAEGALEAARALTRTRGAAWFASGVDRVEDDPFVLATLGDLYVDLAGARHLAEAAAGAFDLAWGREGELTPDARGEAAIAVATAKVAVTRAGLEVTNRLFDAVGARGTAARFGLDRYWRDLRTHTLHDPVDYKRRDLGKWFLTGAWPAPTFYS